MNLREQLEDQGCKPRLEGLEGSARRDQALKELRALIGADPESSHVVADMLLLELIGDAEIAAAFIKLTRWYA